MENEQSLFTPLEATFASQLGLACKRFKELRGVMEHNKAPLDIKIEPKDGSEEILVSSVDRTFVRGMQKCIFSRYKDLSEDHPELANAIVQGEI